MTTQEFSDQFDVLYNNVNSDKAPGLDEYEKSVVLTKAAKQLVREYFDAVTDFTKEGFDGSIKRQYDFSSLVKTAELYNMSHHIGNEITQETLHTKGIPYILPIDFYLPVNELITDSAGRTYSVKPLTYDEYQVKLTKPFAYPNKREAWRVMTDQRGVNFGSTTIVYEGGKINPLTGNSIDDTSAETTVTCYTTFASEGKKMKFTLKVDNTLATKWSTYLDKVTANYATGKTTLTSYASRNGGIDGYMHIERTRNDHNLEEMTCSVYHTTETGKIKLFDDDFRKKVTIAGDYDDDYDIGYYTASLMGEASIVGILRAYMQVCKEKQFENVDYLDQQVWVDALNILSIINFCHWEGGDMKHGLWAVWNGDYDMTNCERKDNVNPRHWDYCDLFDWPQRIKVKDLDNYSTTNPCKLFSVDLTPRFAPIVEVIGRFNGGIKTYMMRYVSRPKPIILEDLSSQSLSIDGYTAVTECDLPEECHEEILERAVTLARLAYGGQSITTVRNNNNNN